MCKQTIKVKFPDGEREVPAYTKYLETQGISRHIHRKTIITPEPMDGWIFRHTMDGQWIAHEDHW